MGKKFSHNKTIQARNDQIPTEQIIDSFYRLADRIKQLLCHSIHPQSRLSENSRNEMTLGLIKLDGLILEILKRTSASREAHGKAGSSMQLTMIVAALRKKHNIHISVSAFLAIKELRNRAAHELSFDIRKEAPALFKSTSNACTVIKEAKASITRIVKHEQGPIVQFSEPFEKTTHNQDNNQNKRQMR